jgi:replicative DNA helicase
MNNTKKIIGTASAEEDTNISIMTNDEIINIDYAELESFHKGDSWFGCSVGFRAMQAAADICTRTSTWSRDNLYIVSGHPGPGVKDAIELITHCVTEKRFRLLHDTQTKGCNSEMKFEWWVSNGHITVHVKLHDNFVPATFYKLVDRLNSDNEKDGDRDDFDQHKNDLSYQIWHRSLENLFDVKVLTTPLSPGDLPGDIFGGLADA